MRKRPMLLLAFVFWLGIFQKISKNPWCICGIIAVLIYANGSLWRMKHWRRLLFRSLLLLVCFGAGYERMACYSERQEENLADIPEKEKVCIQGRITQKEAWGTQIQYSISNGVLLLQKKSIPKISCLVRSNNTACEVGQTVVFCGSVRHFEGARNDGNFDERRYQNSRGFLCAIEDAVVKRWVKKSPVWQKWINRIKEESERILEQTMEKQVAKTMGGILLGMGKEVDKEVKTRYNKSGIVHILTVSALHISVLALGLYRRLRRKWLGNRMAFLVTFPIVWLYANLVGMGLSVRRAMLLFVLGCVSPIFGRCYDLLSGMGLYLLLVLWENPFVYQYTGFIYAVSAVLGIACVVKPIQKECSNRLEIKGGRKWIKKVKIDFISSFFIWMITLPVVVYEQFEIPVYAFAANFFILPFLKILLILGIFGVFAGIGNLSLAKLFLVPAQWILKYFDGVCGFLENIPGNRLIVGSPATIRILLYVALLLGAKALIVSKNTSKKIEKKRFFSGMIGICGALLLLCIPASPSSQMTMLDLGQGEGIFFAGEQGVTCFLDGGSTDVSKVGQYRILPFLKYHGVNSIDYWFVSHGDADHVNGLEELLEEGYPIANLVLGKGMVQDYAWERLVSLAQKNKTKIRILGVSDRVCAGDLQFTSVMPWKEGNDRNENSMVLLAKINQELILLTGDITGEQEEYLMNQKWLPLVAIYKVAHHGSKYANGPEFLTKMSPRLALISCGKENRYGHPAKETLEHIRQAGAKMFCTKDRGQISVLIKEEGIYLREKYRGIDDENN